MPKHSVYKTHYVYKISHKDSPLYYIGVHSSKFDIEICPYMGSSNTLFGYMQRFGRDRFVKSIISVHDTREDADSEEDKLIKQCIKDPMCLNLKVPSAESDAFKKFKNKMIHKNYYIKKGRVKETLTASESNKVSRIKKNFKKDSASLPLSVKIFMAEFGELRGVQMKQAMVKANIWHRFNFSGKFA